MIWLIGSGLMSLDYSKVLEGMGKKYLVVGRGERSALSFKQNTGKNAVTGGLDKYLLTKPVLPDFAIVSVGIESLCDTTKQLLDYGVKTILVEKPAGVDREEILELKKKNEKTDASVYVAYNRRFYSSVIEAAGIIQEDGGVRSFNFEFTEWSHVVGGLEKDSRIKENWFLANSTHVVDMAFFLGGRPREYSCYVAGKDILDWHAASSVFSGAGITEKDALFSYCANWSAPGRWSVEMLTRKHRLIFRPLELLKVQLLSSVEIKPYEIDDRLDKTYKPGLYLQVKAFLEGDEKKLCRLDDHISMLEIYSKIAGYQ